MSKNRSELSPQAAPTNYGAPETEESEAPAYDEQQPGGKLRSEEKADKEKSQGRRYNLGEHIFFQGETGILENT